MPHLMLRRDCGCGDVYGYGYDYGYDQTMREKEGCQNNMAPSDTRHKTSLDSCDAQDPDPMAEGSGIVTTSGLDEDSGHNSKSGDKPKRHEQPTRPRRPKTRSPSNSARHRLTTP